MEKEQEKDLVLMTISTAAHILRKYNEYRRGDHEPCDPPFTAQAIGEAIDLAAELLESSAVKRDIDSIINAVARETGVTDEEMCNKGRQREFAEARAIVAWLARRYTKMSLTSIGKRINRCHGAVVHYDHMVDAWLDEPRLNLRLARITTKLITEIEDGNKEDTDNLSCPA